MLEKEHHAIRLVVSSCNFSRFGRNSNTGGEITSEAASAYQPVPNRVLHQVVERVADLAEQHGVPRVHIALAWLLQKQPTVSPTSSPASRSSTSRRRWKP
jgi:aryl-alcohol dehydrogenase-like predicted oxidoreductase